VSPTEQKGENDTRSVFITKIFIILTPLHSILSEDKQQRKKQLTELVMNYLLPEALFPHSFRDLNARAAFAQAQRNTKSP